MLICQRRYRARGGVTLMARDGVKMFTRYQNIDESLVIRYIGSHIARCAARVMLLARYRWIAARARRLCARRERHATRVDGTMPPFFRAYVYAFCRCLPCFAPLRCFTCRYTYFIHTRYVMLLTHMSLLRSAAICRHDATRSLRARLRYCCLASAARCYADINISHVTEEHTLLLLILRRHGR